MKPAFGFGRVGKWVGLGKSRGGRNEIGEGKSGTE